jgi:two-component system NarL family sensor kinase
VTTRPGQVLALIRLGAVPVFFAAERLVDHPAENTAAFGELLAMAGIYALATAVFELRGRSLAPAPVLAAADFALIALLVATSGGPFSQLRYGFFLLPIGAALLLRPALTALASCLCVLAYAIIALTFPGADDDAAGFEVTQGLFLAWMGGAATLLSALLTRRARAIGELAASRGRLVAQALDAEDRARRRLAEALHDEALQNLLAAKQLLGSDPELARQGLDEGVLQIREAVFDLHPYLLEQSGLGVALRAVAERAGKRGGFGVEVDVDEAAEGVHDQLLFSIGRELVTNAAKHSGASVLRVEVRSRGGDVELVVGDDGRGIDPGRVAGAQADGHIGLASCHERAEAVGGSLAIGRGAGGKGTVARVRLPAPPIGGPPGGGDGSAGAPDRRPMAAPRGGREHASHDHRHAARDL